MALDPRWPLLVVGLLLCLPVLGAPAPVAYTRLANQAGQERLRNGGFDDAVDGRATGWSPYEGGYSLEGGTLRAERSAADQPGAGASQAIVLNQAKPLPLVVTGSSRAEQVSGSSDSDYSLYCDLILADGTPQWGEVASFAVGTHDWQTVRYVIHPNQAVRSMTVHALFRGHTGRVWFDNFSVAELQPPAGSLLLDGQMVTPSAVPGSGPSNELRLGANSARLTAGGGLASLTVGGRELVVPDHPGGFVVRDVAAGGDYLSLAGGSAEQLGLTLTQEATALSDGLRISGQLTAPGSAQGRAVSLAYIVPVGPGWRWTTMRGEEPPEGRPSYGDLVNIGTGSNQLLSRWPLGTISNGTDSLTLAIDPELPAQYRISFAPDAGLLTIAYDFGLSPLTREPNSARFAFALLPGRAGWGLRDGLAAWQRAFPEHSKVRIPRQGIWMAFASIPNVERWEDFGFRIKEGNDETSWDDQHDILTFRYSEMGTYWMAMPPEMPRTYEAAEALLRKQAADPSNRFTYRFANAVLQSGSQDAQGRFQVRFINAPWTDGAVWSLNPSPDLPGELTQAKLSWGDEAQAAYGPGANGVLDGEYLDSLEGYVTAPLNYRPDHLAAARFPLTFVGDQPVIHKAFSIGEFCQTLSSDLHGRDKLLMANGMPYAYGFLTAWFDTMGTETDWGREGNYTPDNDDIMLLRRALSGGKPYLLLMNTRFEQFGPYVERYFQRALAYGMYPSMFSHNAAEDHYFDHPAWYNRDRELFKKYIPRIRQVAEAGWQPMTGVRSAEGQVTVERFGPDAGGVTYVTVHNNSEQSVTDTLTFEAAVIGRGEPARTVQLEPWATQVIELR